MPSISATTGSGDHSKTETAAVRELFALNVEFEVRRRLGREDRAVTQGIIAYANGLPPNTPFPGWDGLWEGYWATL